VALPTGGGEEPPLEVPDEGQIPKVVLADRHYTRFAVARGAEFVRGSLESALFESERFGVVPKVSLPLTFGKLRIRPSVKVESLFDVAGNAEEPVIGEFVAGARVSYRVTPVIEPELHAWTNLTFTDHVEREVNVLVGEATLRLHFGALQAFAGAIVPFVGRLTTDHTFGGRAGAAARF
jgi:hypothetical protein